jgi:phage-related protein
VASTGTVTFQYYSTTSYSWKTISKGTTAIGLSYSSASVKWTPPKGSRKVRVVYGGNTYNVGMTSSSMTITAK